MNATEDAARQEPPPGYRTQSPDTTWEAEQVLFALLRELPSWRKIEMMCSLNRAARELTMAGLRRRFPQADERELVLRRAAMYLDRETMIRATGWDPGPEAGGRE